MNSVPVRSVASPRAHEDKDFCVASITALNSLASFLGPKQVFYCSQDDKIRVPLGVTATQTQSQILMHVQYRVTLPDANWAEAEKYKLIPSFYAGFVVEENGMGDPSAVTHYGPTLVRIRSGRHDSSNAATHASDFEHLLRCEIFKPLCRTEDGLIKPIVIINTDGGPDGNPRYEKVIKFAVQLFKNYNLDALFLVANCPGRSNSGNPVERRLAPLSQQTSGVVLKYDYYGTHLNDRGQTINEELERENFKHAGETLSEIWSRTLIDDFPVCSMYVDPGESEKIADPDQVNQFWFSKHVRTSQYLLQIVKCSEKTCCKAYRSSLREILSTGFLPPPTKAKQSDRGLCRASEINDEAGKFLPLFVQLATDVKPNISGYNQVRKNLQKEVRKFQ